MEPYALTTLLDEKTGLIHETEVAVFYSHMVKYHKLIPHISTLLVFFIANRFENSAGLTF